MEFLNSLPIESIINGGLAGVAFVALTLLGYFMFKFFKYLTNHTHESNEVLRELSGNVKVNTEALRGLHEHLKNGK